MALTKEQKLYCDVVFGKLFNNFGDYITTPSHESRAVEYTDVNNGNWHIRAHWFDHKSTDPARPPKLEVFARNHSSTREVRFAAWFYQGGNGNNCHPEYNGWRVHTA